MIDDAVLKGRFPRSRKYPLDWISEGGMGGNPLWMTEWLCEKLDLQPGMRVLDLGCGYAKSSVFLAREFGVEVWAVDLWVPSNENWARIRQEKLEDRVFPLHCDANSLPFAGEFFDAIVAIDCYPYFGTGDLYLNYLVHFLQPGGQLGFSGAGVLQEITASVPKHLEAIWTQDLWVFHSADWWRRHWERTGLVEIETADAMEDGWKLWSAWHHHIAPDNATEIEAIETDAGQYMGYIRLTGRRKPNTTLAPYAWPDTLKALLQDMKPIVDPQRQEAQGSAQASDGKTD